MVQETIVNEAKLFLENALAEKGINVFGIALFGSYLENAQTKESDIDLIVVSDDFLEKDAFERAEMIAGIDIRLLKKFHVPFDLLLKSKQEYSMLNKKLLMKTNII